ncbi:MAG: type II toxin-antitoxin system RelE/ParE family toxin [Clostridiales bacterium]|nr:type II toxin-antitoxin system RelE/ParE family toxin [Clostridiales bacterium]
MRKYRVRISPEAKQDTLGISEYISNELFSIQSAQRFIHKLHYALSSLSQMPERYPIWLEESDSGYPIRIMPVENYVVFYEIHPDRNQVQILRILYKAQNYSAHVHEEEPFYEVTT